MLLAALAVFAARVNRQRAEFAARVAQSPDRPWLHVHQWDQGRIQDAPANQAASVLGVFAYGWLAVVVGAALLARGRDSTGSSRLRDDVWKEEAPVMTGASVPVAFRVLFNLPESDLPDMPGAGTMRVSWLLSIAASLPGVDCGAVFSVPVFATETSDTTFVTGDTTSDSPPRADTGRRQG